jgi:U3 small nucleolar RNA-associated protein 3
MDELSEDDEIYDLNLPSSSDEDEDEEGADQENIQEEEDDEMIEYEEEEERIEEPRGRFAKSANPSQDLLSDDDNNDKDEDDEASNSDDDEETWAANSYHASRRAPGEADSEDDEALEMEADEARRLQKRQRGVMAGDDFGLGGGAEGDEEELERMREASRKAGKLEEDLVVKVKKGDLSNGEGETKFGTEEEAIAYLLRKQPETLALLDDFTETAERMTNVEKALEIVRLGEDGKEHPALAIMEMEHRTLSLSSSPL